VSDKGIPQLLQYDILVNAIKLGSNKISPFLTQELIHRTSDRQLTVLVDISCDVYNPNNPFPIYNSTTSYTKPTQRVIDDPSNPLDVVAVQNLAGLLPRESSIHFSAQLLPHLARLADRKYPVWDRALQVFRSKTQALRPAANAAPILQLPTDFPRPTGQTVPFNLELQSSVTTAVSVDNTLVSKLNTVAEQHGVRLSTLILSAYQLLAHRLSAEEDFMVGVLANETQHAACYGIRSSLTSNTVFADLVAANHALVRKEQLMATPFAPAALSAYLRSNAPTYQTMITYNVVVDDTIVRESLAQLDAVLLISQQDKV
jgi:hypothetical protein